MCDKVNCDNPPTRGNPSFGKLCESCYSDLVTHGPKDIEKFINGGYDDVDGSWRETLEIIFSNKV